MFNNPIRMFLIFFPSINFCPPPFQNNNGLIKFILINFKPRTCGPPVHSPTTFPHCFNIVTFYREFLTFMPTIVDLRVTVFKKCCRSKLIQFLEGQASLPAWWDRLTKHIFLFILIAKRKLTAKLSGSIALLCRDMVFDLSVLRWTIQHSFVSHMTIFHYFACATTAGQRFLRAGLLKMGLSDSGWLKIKFNNSIWRGGEGG